MRDKTKAASEQASDPRAVHNRMPMVSHLPKTGRGGEKEAICNHSANLLQDYGPKQAGPTAKKITSYFHSASTQSSVLSMNTTCCSQLAKCQNLIPALRSPFPVIHMLKMVAGSR